MKIKKIIVFLIMLILIIGTTLTVFAGDDFISEFGPQGNDGVDKVGNALGIALGIIQVIGVAVAVIMLMILGIKYMTSAPNDRAEIKKHAVVYIVGAIIMFGAAGIVEVIKQFGVNFGQ